MHTVVLVSAVQWSELVIHTHISIFPGGSDGKASAYNAGDPGSILGGEDVLEKEMASHSSILAWKIPWMEEPGRLQSMGSQRVGHDWATSLSHIYLGFPGGSDSTESAWNAGDLGLIPGLGRSLEKSMATHSSILAWRDPMDRAAWQAAVHAVTKSWTWPSD